MKFLVESSPISKTIFLSAPPRGHWNPSCRAQSKPKQVKNVIFPLRISVGGSQKVSNSGISLKHRGEGAEPQRTHRASRRYFSSSWKITFGSSVRRNFSRRSRSTRGWVIRRVAAQGSSDGAFPEAGGFQNFHKSSLEITNFLAKFPIFATFFKI